MNNMNDNFFKSIQFKSYYWHRVMMSLCIGKCQRSNICFCWLWLWNFSDSCCYMILRSRHLYVLNITYINQNQSKYLRKHILWYFALLPHIVFGSKYFYVLLVNRIFYAQSNVLSICFPWVSNSSIWWKNYSLINIYHSKVVYLSCRKTVYHNVLTQKWINCPKYSYMFILDVTT